MAFQIFHNIPIEKVTVERFGIDIIAYKACFVFPYDKAISKVLSAITIGDQELDHRGICKLIGINPNYACGGLIYFKGGELKYMNASTLPRSIITLPGLIDYAFQISYQQGFSVLADL